MNEKIDLNQLLLDGEFLTSNRKLYLDDFEDETQLFKQIIDFKILNKE